MLDRLCLAVRQILRRSAVDPVLLLILHAPFHAIGRNPLRAFRHVREEQLPHGQRLKGLVPEHADIDLASLDVLLDERCGADAVVDEGDALLQLLIAVDDRSLRDADGGFLREGLHDERELQPLGPTDRPAAAEDFALGHRDAVVGEQLFRQRLVAREQQAARIAAGVGQLQQLQVADDVLVEDRDVVEPLEEIERDVRLPVRRRPADVAQVVVHAESLHFVAHGGERRNHVVFSAPRLGGDVDTRLDTRRRNEMPVHQRQHTEAAHRHMATRCRPLCR